MPDTAAPTPQDSQELSQAVEDVCEWLGERSGGCVLFLGAAFSARDKSDPDAGGVLSADELRRIFNPVENDLAETLEREKRPEGSLARFLEEHFWSRDSTRFTPKRVHHLVARLPFRTVITTNCDDLMEEAYKSIWKDVAGVVFDKDLSKLGTTDIDLIKPHGCVIAAQKVDLDARSRDDIFVFKRSQYDNFFAVDPPSQTGSVPS